MQTASDAREIKLYDELVQGRPPDTVLRAAKLSLLRSNTVFRKPYYWAPFQLYSEQIPLEKQSFPAASRLATSPDEEERAESRHHKFEKRLWCCGVAAIKK